MNRSFGRIKDIILDPERAPIIKEAFEKAAYQYYTGEMVKNWMDSAGFKTKNRKRITRSMTYLMLKNPFYYGQFEFPVGSNQWYKGAYEPIISNEVFYAVQKEISTDKIYNFGKVIFPLKGIFTCYSCGSGICGKFKKRKLKNGGFRNHVYYHCTRSRNPKCK